MVPAYSNPTSDDGGGGGGGGGMVLGRVMASMSAASVLAGAGVDDLSRKIRKPYILTRSRENWSDQEHNKFVEALQLFDRDWKKIEAFVNSKTVIQIRSHAQKYFLKVQKNRTSEYIPPPRPKRKAAHPYPQKASKKGNSGGPQKASKKVPLLSKPAAPFHASSLLEQEIMTNDYSGDDIPSSPNAYPACEIMGQGNHVASHSVTLLSQPAIPFHTSFLEQGNAPLTNIPEKVSSWAHTSNNPSSANVTSENMTNYCSGADSRPSPNTYPAAETGASHSGMSDFSEVYGFIGSIFDQSKSDQLDTLNDINPIDAEPVMLFMRNRSMNLTSPDFEDHRMLLASYEMGAEEVNPMYTPEDDETDPFMFNAE